MSEDRVVPAREFARHFGRYREAESLVVGDLPDDVVADLQAAEYDRRLFSKVDT